MSTEKGARVSIGLPVYNGQRFLTETIESLLAQSYTDFELVICDNCSTDRTAEIAADFARRDPRVRHHRNDTTVGAAANFNRAVELTRGEYFKWAADDDLCEQQFLEQCVTVLDSAPDVVLAYPRAMIVDEDGGPIGPYELKLETDRDDPVVRFEALLRTHRCFEVFGLMRRGALLNTPLMGAYSHGDGILLSRLALQGKLHQIPDFLFKPRRHGNQSMERFRGDYQSYAEWFDPKLRDKRIFPYWRIYYEHLRSVRRSGLGVRDRLRCYGHIARWARYLAPELWKDVAYQFKRRSGEKQAS